MASPDTTGQNPGRRGVGGPPNDHARRAWNAPLSGTPSQSLWPLPSRAAVVSHQGSRRQDAHGQDPGHTAYQRNPAFAHQMGFAGEEAFSHRYHLEPDTRQLSQGDSGHDFVTPIGTVQVKTRDAKYGKDLFCLVEEKYLAQLSRWVVFAEYEATQGIARLIGWTTDVVMWGRPLVVVNAAIGRNAMIPRALLCPMNHLACGGLVDYHPDAYCCAIHGRSHAI